MLTLRHIDDLQPYVQHRKEICFRERDGVIISGYPYSDKDTFDTPQSLECRGAAFDANGVLISRPLHKFFNLGEKADVSLDTIKQRSIARVFEKIDGSMIATANMNGQAVFRSKGSFHSDVVKLANKMIGEGFGHIQQFSQRCVDNGLTAIFELTHPLARIVVDPKDPNLRLLHVRDNLSGAYVMLDRTHPVHQWIAEFGVETVPALSLSLEEVIDSLETMEHQEGYVLQFDDGDMVKLKCPWYLRLHRSVTFLRERDVALLAFHEELDDLKSMLRMSNMDVSEVEAIESRLKHILLEHNTAVEQLYQDNKHLDKKGFAMAVAKHPFSAMAINMYVGKEDNGLRKWYLQKQLSKDFGLRVLNDGALDEVDTPAPKAKM